MADRIAFFGGTFDPVHHGHLIVARALAEARGFDRVSFVPAGMPPHKAPATASAANRLAMLRLAITGEPLLDICEIELHHDGPSYTIETVKSLQEKFTRATIHWVIGADMLEDLPSWYRAGELLERVTMVIAARPPWQDRIEGILAALAKRFSREQVERLRAGVTPTPLLDISSTDIRRRVAEGRPIRYLVPDAVAEYIATKSLYKSPER